MTFVETMKPRERVLNALSGKPVDRPPLCNPTSVFTVELMDLAGAPFPEACWEPELNASLAATGYTELGFDSTYHHASIIQEASALGCDIQWGRKDNFPNVSTGAPLWKGPDDIRIPAGFLDHRDTRCILRSTEILKREYGGEAAIVGKVTGPWTLGYHVFGVEPFLLMSIEDPDATLRCLHRLKEVSVLFGQAQIAAGADVLTFADHATGDMVKGEFYRRFLFDIHSEMAERLSVPLILHICGKTLDRMDYIAQTGMAAFHFDSKNDPYEAMKVVDGRIALVGNINNPETLFNQGPEEVRQEVFRCLDAGVSMIAPECAVPLNAKLDNLMEIKRAVLDWSSENS